MPACATRRRGASPTSARARKARRACRRSWPSARRRGCLNDGVPAMSLDTPQLLAIAAALGWASGLRLYAVVFLTGMAGYLGWVDLPSGLKMLQHPAMLGASGMMLFVEFFADKIPGVDTLWDMVHTVVRIPAGAALAASVFG